jgi:hypothetical protein
MKKTILYLFAGVCTLILLESFGNKGLGKVDGTEPGYTGSPGDTLKNCTICHGGTAVNVQNWISSNIPSTGFVAGSTYTIRAVNTLIGHNRFGFSISPQALDGKLLGTMLVTDTVRTKLVGNNKYITYRAAGVQALDSNVWEFQWVAPTDGTKEVVFYGAFNSNIDGHKGQDVTRLSTLKVWREGFVSVNENNVLSQATIFPYPAKQHITIQLPHILSVRTEISLYDTQGRLMLTSALLPGETQNQLDVSALPNGLYFVKMQSALMSHTQKMLLQQ